MQTHLALALEPYTEDLQVQSHCRVGKDGICPSLCSAARHPPGPAAPRTRSSSPWAASGEANEMEFLPFHLLKSSGAYSWFTLFAGQFKLYCLAGRPAVWSAPTWLFQARRGFALLTLCFSHAHLCKPLVWSGCELPVAFLISSTWNLL